MNGEEIIAAGWRGREGARWRRREATWRKRGKVGVGDGEGRMRREGDNT